jgi:hypothetical protein
MSSPDYQSEQEFDNTVKAAKAEAYKEIGEWLSEWRLKEHNISSVLLDLIAKLQKGTLYDDRT